MRHWTPSTHAALINLRERTARRIGLRAVQRFITPAPGSLSPQEHWLSASLRTVIGETLLFADAAMIGLVGLADVHRPHVMVSWRDFHLASTLFWFGLAIAPVLIGGKFLCARRHRIREGTSHLKALGVCHEIAPRLTQTIATVVTTRHVKDKKRTPQDRQRYLRSSAESVLTEAVSTVASIAPRQPNERYAANIMRMVPSTFIHGAFGERVTAALKIEEVPPTWSAVRGVLLLDPQLSISSDDLGPDPMVGDFAFLLPLPLPDGTFRQDGFLMPGAPTAFFTKRLTAVDQLRLLAECQATSNVLSDGGMERMRSYLTSAQGRHVQSFISHPLLADTKYLPKAVLNVHTNTRALDLDEAQRLELSYLLRLPSLALLEILEELVTVEQGLGEWGSA